MVVLPWWSEQAWAAKRNASHSVLSTSAPITADGIAGANEIIAGSLSREYLSWYWIDNLQNHDSVVYMIPSEGGIPLFKDIDSIISSETDSTTDTNIGGDTDSDAASSTESLD